MSGAVSSAHAEFPDALGFLFEPARYKIAYGGRGGAKSWGAARALLIQGVEKPLRVLCAREFQNSISDSVHKLLSDQVSALGLDAFYEVQNAVIKGRNGTEFAFAGLRHNVARIKSFEGVDRVWVEEAQAVSKSSWETLIPTIRKEGSEIWITFNPELDTDETYRRFVLNPPSNAVVRKVNWSDNPWFGPPLSDEKDSLKERDPDAYLTVWEGHCRQTLDGAIYAKEIRQATEGGRITRVPYDATKPVHTFWDLGWSDNTSVWMAQAVGFEYRIIDFIQDSQKALPHYLGLLQATGYVFGTDYLPHDAQAKSLAGAGRTIEQLMRASGRKVQIIPRMSVADGINAARTVFPNCWFDEVKCADGLQALRRYRYEVDEVTGQFSRTPLHDAASHASDAFRYLAVSLRDRPDKKQTKPKLHDFGHMTTGWMG
jgi:phage terminase large subunit